ncbi:hypothetical protein ACRQ5Q_23980 [Bradyrhizobium sp. PMVTL-01]|uniref:hypothetical protein n=1 Tax=unclassified Bradyrhizobium TaxID=2631580 RepID=UPI003F728BA4
MPAAEYYLKQAEIASRLARAEPDPEKARAMHIMALSLFDKAHRAQVKDTPAPPESHTVLPVIERQ